MSSESKKNIIDSVYKEVESENELLLSQLQKVQEELERIHSKNSVLQKAGVVTRQGGGIPSAGLVDSELIDVLADAENLRAMVDVQREVSRLQSCNALNAKLGDVLIRAADHPATLFYLPVKLIQIWRQTTRKNPPASLGGKGFDKVISAYATGGFEAVGHLLAGVPSGIQANAYTTLARSLLDRDRVSAAVAAKTAYVQDPKPFRLKWLAFRMHEAGDVVEAAAILDVLPAETKYSESEARQAKQLRFEAKQARQHRAEEVVRFAEGRAKVEKHLADLENEKSEKEKLLAKRDQELEVLKAQLNQERKVLIEQEQFTSVVLADRDSQIASLKQERVLFESEISGLKIDLNSINGILAERDKSLTELAGELNSQNEKIAGMAVELRNLTDLVSARDREIKALSQGYEQKIDGLSRETLVLNEARSQLALDYQNVQAMLRQRDIELGALRQEKSGVSVEHERAKNLAAERLSQNQLLQKELHACRSAEVDLKARYQLMREEIVRAESQLALIKEVLLRELRA